MLPLRFSPLYAAALWPLLASCTKTANGPTLADGHVIVDATNQPVAGAHVRLWAQRGTGLHSGYEPVDTSYTTDAQGRFSFSFDAQADSRYVLRAEKEPGYSTNWGYEVALQEGRQNTAVRLPVQAPAWVRVQLVDEAPKSTILLVVQGYSGAGESFRYPKDTTVIRPLMAGFITSIAWFITEHGQNRQAYTPLKPAPLDTVTVRIAF